MKIISSGSELELLNDNIIIRKRGLRNAFASGLNGDRTISISSINAIQMKPGGVFVNGYILFSYAGCKPFFGGIIEAVKDPDAFIFPKTFNEKVEIFKGNVERIMRELKQKSNNISTSLADELNKLSELKSRGVISETEFDAAKKKIIF